MSVNNIFKALLEQRNEEIKKLESLKEKAREMAPLLAKKKLELNEAKKESKVSQVKLNEGKIEVKKVKPLKEAVVREGTTIIFDNNLCTIYKVEDARAWDSLRRHTSWGSDVISYIAEGAKLFVLIAKGGTDKKYNRVAFLASNKYGVEVWDSTDRYMKDSKEILSSIFGIPGKVWNILYGGGRIVETKNFTYKLEESEIKEPFSIAICESCGSVYELSGKEVLKCDKCKGRLDEKVKIRINKDGKARKVVISKNRKGVKEEVVAPTEEIKESKEIKGKVEEKGMTVSELINDITYALKRLNTITKELEKTANNKGAIKEAKKELDAAVKRINLVEKSTKKVVERKPSVASRKRLVNESRVALEAKKRAEKIEESKKDEDVLIPVIRDKAKVNEAKKSSDVKDVSGKINRITNIVESMKLPETYKTWLKERRYKRIEIELKKNYNIEV